MMGCTCHTCECSSFHYSSVCTGLSRICPITSVRQENIQRIQMMRFCYIYYPPKQQQINKTKKHLYLRLDLFKKEVFFLPNPSSEVCFHLLVVPEGPPHVCCVCRAPSGGAEGSLSAVPQVLPHHLHRGPAR